MQSIDPNLRNNNGCRADQLNFNTYNGLSATEGVPRFSKNTPASMTSTSSSRYIQSNHNPLSIQGGFTLPMVPVHSQGHMTALVVIAMLKTIPLNPTWEWDKADRATSSAWARYACLKLSLLQRGLPLGLYTFPLFDSSDCRSRSMLCRIVRHRSLYTGVFIFPQHSHLMRAVSANSWTSVVQRSLRPGLSFCLSPFSFFSSFAP